MPNATIAAITAAAIARLSRNLSQRAWGHGQRGKRLVSAAAGHGLTSTGLPFRRRSADRTARGYL